jgi:hypothetical protein
MSNPERESPEEQIDEEGANPTQQKIDEEDADERPVDAGWEETSDQPHQGEEGQDLV